ncbi:MAG TPA: neutral zinc metallopeptidase [Acidimicrobiales bacterium]|nr:neutral zinc metallopeptidase [Acidimicrobiales bacterium]
MRFRRNAQLDTSQVSDRRGMRPMAVGGGGIVGIIVLVLTLLNGGGGGGETGLELGGANDEGSGAALSAECTTGEDANQRDDCRIVGVINSVQAYWQEVLPDYHPAKTVFFTGGTNTGCGNASSAVGPFYCPLDSQIYIDLGFYDDLRTRFGARGGPFAEAYVIAHEYGHHVENLRGVLERAQEDRDTGPQSSAVRVELMADCLAGMWANGAVETGFIEELTDDDIRDGLDAASVIGDDRIQEKAQGQVNPESWTHGSSAQRQRWFLQGYETGSIEECDTFSARTV